MESIKRLKLIAARKVVGKIYYNHHPYLAATWWERWTFLRQWWWLHSDDPYWVPPDYIHLWRSLEPRTNPHLARLSPIYLYLEALRRRGRRLSPDLSGPTFERTVGAGIVLNDPRRRDGVAYLSSLACVNDSDSLERLLTVIGEQLATQRVHTLVGPVGVSPHLGSGLLQDYWNVGPPLHTPYQPPYMPELMGQVFRPRWRSQLYHLDILADRPAPSSSPVQLVPLTPARLHQDLFPLFQAACPPWADFAPPDELEAAFIIEWVGRWPLLGWLAVVDEQPVGFILLQPDLAHRLRQAKGGRNPLLWLWLQVMYKRPVKQGRLLFGAVLPAWRRQGIGRQLLQQALQTAQTQGWQSLTIGPLPTTGPANQFLQKQGATAQQTYLLYQATL